MNKNQKKWLIAGLIILSLGLYFGWIPLDMTGIPQPPVTDQPEATEYVYFSGIVVDAISRDAVGSATVKVKLPDGQIVSYTSDSTDGTFTSNLQVLEGSKLIFQVEKSGYYTAVIEREIPTGDWSERDTADIGILEVYDISGSNSMSIRDQDGNAITSTSAYNVTESGTDMTLNVLFSINEDDSAAGNSYTDIKSGDVYLGPMIVIKITDITNLTVDFSYDKLVTIGTTYYFIIYVERVIDDSDVANDGSLSMSLAFTVLETSENSSDVLSIYFYDEVQDIQLEAGNFGTALASVTGIDIWV